jgi:hypothetical protein
MKARVRITRDRRRLQQHRCRCLHRPWRDGHEVTNTPGVLTESTADFAWALLLAQ